jgi:hypothetical protein
MTRKDKEFEKFLENPESASFKKYYEPTHHHNWK